MTFSYENLGTNTFLVYEIKDNDEIDSMSLGMLTNNSIPGFAPVTFTQMDATKYIKYNVSSKVSVSQLFSGPVNRKRLLGVFTGIVNAMLSAEDYMLDPQTVIMNMDYIFTDVSTCETTLVCLPVAQEERPPVDLGMFFKNIIFTTQYDQTENCDHVAQILNYLNRAPVLSLDDFKSVLDQLNGTAVPAAPVQPRPVSPQPVAPQPAAHQPQPVSPQPQPAHPQTQHVPAVTQPPVVQRPSMTAQPPVKIPPVDVPPVNVPPAAPPVDSNAPGAADGQKPMSAFYLLQHYNKENAAIYKEQQKLKKQQGKKPKKEKPAQNKQAAFNVPGQAPQTPFAVPGQAPQTPFAVPGQPAPAVSGTAAPVQQPVVHRPAVQQPAVQQPAVAQPVIQKPVVQQPVTPKPVPTAINFGGTVVLGGEPQGTTVLGAVPEAAEVQPYLIRVKTGEKIMLNRPTFKLGKEQSYVDYPIQGNSAISRSHATIYNRNGQFLVEDTNSTNHTYVDGKVIPSNVPTPMTHGCKLRLADEEFEFKMF